MPTFVKSVLVAAPVEEVFAFHERTDALPLLSPPFPPVRVIRRDGGIEEGARVELRIGPIRWVAVHGTFERNRLFEDRQVDGPFTEWTHRHQFESVAGGTRLTDRIDYRLPGGEWMNRLASWAVEVGLNQMFRYRHEQTKRHCERRS